PAATIMDACVFTNVFVCFVVADVWLYASTVLSVLVTVRSEAVPPVASPPTWFTVALLQASVAVGAVNDGVPVHSIVASAPAAPITGGVVSTIVIVCVLVAE